MVAMMNKKYATRNTRFAVWAAGFALLLAVLIGCRPAWETTLLKPDGTAFLVDGDVLKGLSSYAEDRDGRPQAPLERVLVAGGHRLVERLVITDAQGTRRELDWGAVADDAWWLKDGRLGIGDETFSAASIEIVAPPLLGQVQARIIDIAPTVAAALGIPAPAQATGRVLEAPRASHVVLLFLDGFGYVRYTEALRDGLIPHLAALGEPLVALTTYPPVTNVSSASLLTGAPPDVHGADSRGIRTTEVETLFDVATNAGLRVVAVEGDALAFNLRNADVQLSGDRDGNGSTDDNVLANALSALAAGMPDLFWVHFHGIDDAGHTYGPGAPEEQAKVGEVDAEVGQLIAALPSDTLILMFADHGMHAVDEGGRRGNHGHLIARDMVIPIFVLSK